jgi:hypothetical protein
MGFTQFLTEGVSETRKNFVNVERGRRVRLKTSLPSVNRLSRQCLILNISQTYRLPQSVMGKVLLYLYVDDVRTSQEAPASTICYGDSFISFLQEFKFE